MTFLNLPHCLWAQQAFWNAAKCKDLLKPCYDNRINRIHASETLSDLEVHLVLFIT